MGSKNRIDMPDTLDPVIGLLHRLQAEGWGLAALDHSIEYSRTTPKSPQFPTSATVTVRLIPKG